jgi:4-amino-4-deoxy-L-arabinose transferase-like glycosyltransferase
MAMTGRARLVTAVLAAALLAAFLVQCLALARANAQTYDEGVEVAAGLRLLETGADDINLEHPPLSKWLVAWPVHHFALPHLDVGPWRARRESAFGLGRDLFHNSGVAPERLLWLARLPVIGTALLVVLLTGTLAWRLWGPRAGVLALALAAFDPTLVAHGALASTDMPLTLCVVAAYACLGEWLRSWRLSWLCLAGVAVGLAAATKFSGPLFAGGLGVALVVSALADRVMPAWWAPTDPARTRPTAVLAALANGALLTLLGLLTLRLLLGAGGWPSFLVGLQAQLAHQAAGHPAFFLGRLSIASARGK